MAASVALIWSVLALGCSKAFLLFLAEDLNLALRSFSILYILTVTVE